MSVITVLMDLPSETPVHQFTIAALDHAIAVLDTHVEVVVSRTDEIGLLGDAVVIGPGSPYRDPVATEAVIKSARAGRIPLVGT